MGTSKSRIGAGKETEERRKELRSYFEWKVRGLLDVMQEMWSGSVSRLKSVVSHAINIRERLASMSDLVEDNIKEAELRQKKWSDTKSKMRDFRPGQEALLLLPSSSNALESKCKAHSKLTEKFAWWTMKSRQTTKDGS